MKVQVTTTINAPAENIWKTLRAYDNVESFNPLVKSSTISGTEECSERVCQVQFGDQEAELVEKLDQVNEEQKTMKISLVQAPPQLSGKQFTFQVKSLDENKAELQISSEVPDNQEETGKQIQGIFQMMSDGLKKLHEKRVN